jgi:hypothetical protein
MGLHTGLYIFLEDNEADDKLSAQFILKKNKQRVVWNFQILTTVMTEKLG